MLSTMLRNAAEVPWRARDDVSTSHTSGVAPGFTGPFGGDLVTDWTHADA